MDRFSLPQNVPSCRYANHRNVRYNDSLGVPEEARMRACGVSLKGSEAIFAIVAVEDDGTFGFEFNPTKKLTIGNDKSADDLRHFRQSAETFVRDNKIDLLVIRQRAHSGKMAGGAISFKMEAALQLGEGCRCEFISPQAISKHIAKNNVKNPDKLLVYQEESFYAAVTYLAKASI